MTALFQAIRDRLTRLGKRRPITQDVGSSTVDGLLRDADVLARQSREATDRIVMKMQREQAMLKKAALETDLKMRRRDLETIRKIARLQRKEPDVQSIEASIARIEGQIAEINRAIGRRP